MDIIKYNDNNNNNNNNNNNGIIYNKKFIYTKKNIIILYINLLIYYQNKINNLNNNCFYNGISILTTVFKIMLLYTKNQEVAKYYTTNSIIYFCEFIKLIHADNLTISYSEIKSFIYDKTILLIDKNQAYTNKYNNCNIPSEIYTLIINLLFISTKKDCNNNILRIIIKNDNIINTIMNNYTDINIDTFIDEILYNK